MSENTNEPKQNFVSSVTFLSMSVDFTSIWKYENSHNPIHAFQYLALKWNVISIFSFHFQN